MDPLYLTTAIPFVNARAASRARARVRETDVIARHARAPRPAVRFLTGTDEHAPKIVQAAAAAGVDVARVRRRRTRTCSPRSPTRCEVSYDDFIRTSADPRHRAGGRGDLARVRRAR